MTIVTPWKRIGELRRTPMTSPDTHRSPSPEETHDRRPGF